MIVKVVKFGGSSLADAEHFVKVANIIKSDASRRYIVPSAPGKRHKDDKKVTDMLYACHDMAAKGESIDGLFDEICERYESIIRGLNLEIDLSGKYREIKENILNDAGSDYTASRGEYLNGIILSEYLGVEFVDAADVIFFDKDGNFDSKKTKEFLKSRLGESAVIPGFYGSAYDGKIKTFSRGGSDITGSIVAYAVMADVYENWTDVSGFMMADPRIVDNPKTIDVVTYRELRELSYMGATVLHEDAIFPVRMAGIPINIKNTNDPDNPGTMILAHARSDDAVRTVTGIAGKRGFAIITLEKDMMNSELGFGRRVLGVLENHKIPFEHLPSGIDTLSIVVNEKDIVAHKDAVISELQDKVNPDSIDYTRGLAVIAVVGRGMISTPGTAAKIFAAIAECGVNIRMIDQGSSELNIIIGVDEKDFETALRAIYKAFVPEE